MAYGDPLTPDDPVWLMEIVHLANFCQWSFLLTYNEGEGLWEASFSGIGGGDQYGVKKKATAAIACQHLAEQVLSDTAPNGQTYAALYEQYGER